MKKTIISIIVIILILAAMTGILMLADKFFYSYDAENVVTQESYAADGIVSVTVGVDVGYVEIVEKDGSDSFSVSTVGVETGFYTVSVDGGTLSVSSNELKWYDRELYKTADSYGITISVPASFDGDVNILTNAGTVTVTALTAKSLDITADIGNVTVTGAAIPVIDVYADMGNIKIENADSDAVTLEADVGNVSFSEAESDTLLSSLSVTVDIGNIAVSVCGERNGYTVNAHADTGKCNVESGGDGIPLDLSVDVGDITVTFG